MTTESPLTPKQLFDRVCDSIAAPVAGERRDIGLALLRAGRTIFAAGLRELSEVEREGWLLEFEDHVRQLLSAWAALASSTVTKRRRMLQWASLDACRKWLTLPRAETRKHCSIITSAASIRKPTRMRIVL